MARLEHLSFLNGEMRRLLGASVAHTQQPQQNTIRDNTDVMASSRTTFRFGQAALRHPIRAKSTAVQEGALKDGPSKYLRMLS